MRAPWYAFQVLGLCLLTSPVSAQPQVNSPSEASIEAPSSPEADLAPASDVPTPRPALTPRATPALKISWSHAQRTLTKAAALFDAGNYDAALQQFTEAYDLLAGHHRRYAVLNNIAVCHERLFHYGLAVENYERYLAEAPQQTGDRKEVQRIVETLSALLATVEVQSDASARLWVDGRQLEDAPGKYRLPAGRRVFELHATGRENVQLEVTLRARETRMLPVHLPVIETYRGLSPTYFYLTAALTGALAVGAGALGVAFLAKRSDAREVVQANMALPTEASRQDQKTLDRLSLAADLTLVGALITGATTVVLYLLSDFDNESGAPPQVLGTLTSGQSLECRGRF